MNQILILLLFSFSLNCTNIDECEYEKYFTNISKALNEKYANEDWGNVNEIFKTAINSVDVAYGKDLEEALEVALKVGDKTFSKQIIIKLIKGGIPIQYFDNNDAIKKEKYWEEIENNYFEIRNGKSTFNQKLRNELISLRLRDSIFNVQYHEFRKGKKVRSLEYLTKEAQGIHQQFMAMVEMYGFPSEKNVGYFYNDGKIQNSPLMVVLIHIHQNGEYIIGKDYSYEKLVCQGHLSEFQFDHLTDIISMGRGKGSEFEMKHFFGFHIDQY